MLQNIFSHRPPLYDVFDKAELYVLHAPCTCKQALVGLESGVRKEFGQNVDDVVFYILISYAVNIF